MKFERLRLAGFKTFVDPTDIIIAPGLTGVVGPNGCGKSNLVEALRWAMGETSSKSLRGDGMEDVIFAGSSTRPERNHAEVSIRIIDPPGDLPGHLAGAEQLEISRKITRDQGSTFRINGREVRARDVQILFADAASGARSPSMVRQGQIGEIIAAKPQHRRRILEDAAGVAGLHARRHEAELRLKQADDNLVRAEDVLTQLDRQIGDLRRQARQAERYKQLSAQIRTLDLQLMAHSHARASAETLQADAAHDLAIREIAGAMRLQGEAERTRANSEQDLENARKASGEAANRLGRLIGERETLNAALQQIERRLADIGARRAEVDADRDGAERLGFDADEALQRLQAEAARLDHAQGEAQTKRGIAEQALEVAAQAHRALEAQLAAAQALAADARAQRRAAEQRQNEAQARLGRIAASLHAANAELQAAAAADRSAPEIATLQAGVEDVARRMEAALKASAEAEASLRAAGTDEQAARPKLAEAERLFQRLETEARTIRKLVDAHEPGLWTPAIDRISVQKGYEPALAAALGDDLEAALEAGAPRFWAEPPTDFPEPALPEGALALVSVVDAPPALGLRLRQIGIVAQQDGPRMQAQLAQGQRLVSLEGDLWRWDGFVRKAEAPSAAARRMAERNRLGEIESEAERARIARQSAREIMDGAIRALKSAQEIESRARESVRRLGVERENAASALARALSRTEAARLRLESLKLKVTSLTGDHEEAGEALRLAAQAMAAMPPLAEPDEIAALPARLAGAREAENTARLQLGMHQAGLDAAQTRRSAIGDERIAWEGRAARAKATLGEHQARVARLLDEQTELAGQPAQLMARRRTLLDDIEAAERADHDLRDRLAQAETRLREHTEAARGAFQALSAARESAARLEAQREASQIRLASVVSAIETSLAAPLGTLPQRLAEIGPQTDIPPERIEARLIDLKHERERVGAVNLRADIELSDIDARRSALLAERDDITEAIRRLRRAIDTLNSEGRTRLRGAFDAVNAHFGRLFVRLFGGGAAELKLIEADDPLEAGLEIIARPPGKTPQLLSLLSGGEQALTATALIFAVFLTNPSPICVLDEVDAPLDDSNVERLCDLLHDMARETSTRFFMITHNPISMARMDRLYGVTMVERGVSQLVSVDLAGAERLAQAG